MSDETVQCEGCDAKIRENEKAHYHSDGVTTCAKCAPTLEVSLIESERRVEEGSDDPHLTAAVAVRIARALADGATLKSPDVW